MKKAPILTLCLLPAVVWLLFTLVSCGVTKIPYTDSAVPRNELCTLVIADKLTVKKFDGKDVHWGGRSEVEIPQGFHVFDVKFSFGRWDGVRFLGGSRDNIFEVRHNFIAQGSYYMTTSLPTVTFRGVSHTAIEIVIEQFDKKANEQYRRQHGGNIGKP